MAASGGFDAIVIGAGANGLVAALTLARAGRRVLVLEQAGAIGRTLEFAPGFRADPLAFDAGWVPPPVGRLVGRVLDVAHPDVPIELLSPDGQLPLARDPSRAADAIRRHSNPDAARWPAFTERVRAIAGVLEALYQLPAPDIGTTSPKELLTLLRLGGRIRSLGREDMTALFRVLPMSIHELLGDWFESDLLRATVAAGGVQDLQQGPRSGGTAFVLLHHLTGAGPGTLRGRGYWREGPEAFTRVLVDRATASGVSIRTGASVEHITVRDDAVRGIVLDSGEEIATPVVVSTADPKATFLQLVSPEWLDPEFLQAVGNIRYRACAVFLLFAMDALPESLNGAAHDGMLTLTGDLDVLERAADAAKYGTASEHPHVECLIPSLRWSGQAPSGQHVILARAQYAPYAQRNGDPWGGEEAMAFADRVTRVMEAVMPGFSARVLHRVVLSPRDVEARYRLTHGALTHGELGLDQILFMRPVPGWGRHRMPIDGLYLGGAGTHPGPGIVGGSGWLAAREVLA